MSQERLDLIHVGLHSSNSDFTTFPTTIHSVDAVWNAAYDYERLRSESMRADGKKFPSRNGFKTGNLPNLSVPLRGAKTSGAGTAASSGAGANNVVCDTLLECVFGAGATGATGEATDAADAGSGTTVTASAASSFAAGDGLIVRGSTSSRYQARQVVSVATADITVDRELTDDGVSDTAVENTAIYAMDTYELAFAEHKHTHMGLKISKDDGAVDRWIGMMPSSLELQFPAGQEAKLVLSGFDFTDHDTGSSASTYVTPTAGENVDVIDSPLWIGSSEYLAYDTSLQIALEVVPRTADGTRNGKHGFIVTDKTVTITTKIRVGDLTREVAESFMNTLRGSASDVAFQHGETPGGISYVRAPVCDARSVQLITENGQRMVQVTWEVARSSSGTSTLSLHLG